MSIMGKVCRCGATFQLSLTGCCPQRSGFPLFSMLACDTRQFGRQRPCFRRAYSLCRTRDNDSTSRRASRRHPHTQALLAEVLVMLSVVRIVLRTRSWYEQARIG
jgi:hypothetical protein